MQWVAHELLDEALRLAVEAGRRPPCWGPARELWTAENVQSRARAAQLCDGCPVLAECASAAEESDEQWHVWAGVDRTRRFVRHSMAS